MTKKIDIITMAANLHKPTKAEILALIRDIIDSDNYTLNDRETAELFSYFIPATPQRAKTPQQWVARAAAAKDIRNYLNFVYSDGERLIATDGHRLHWIETEEYPKGYYIPSTLDAITCNDTYPDIDRVIPATYAKDCQQCKLSEFKVIDTGKHGLAYKLPNDTYVNKKYLAAVYNRDAEMLLYLPGDSLTSIKAESLDGKRHAVVMPVRLPKVEE